MGNTFTRNFKYNDAGSNILHAIKKADDVTNYSDFTYDVNGNRLTAGSERKYIWDQADQLKAYINQTGTGEPSVYAQYLYSGGQRVKKLVRTDNGGATEATVYIDGVFEHRYNSSAQSQTITRVGGVAATRVGHAFGGLSGTTYELSNHLGSVNYRLDNNGSDVDAEEYYPFGDSSVRTWTQGSKQYRYVGKEKDAESGLYYYGARYYAAWTCRFISIDPLAWEYPFYTPYQYAANKPINHIDIDGMQANDGQTREHATGSYDSDTSKYTVAKGDTLFSIAERFGVDWRQLAKANKIPVNGDHADIEVGSTITISVPEGGSKAPLDLSTFSLDPSIKPSEPGTLQAYEPTYIEDLHDAMTSEFDASDFGYWAGLPGRIAYGTVDAIWVWSSQFWGDAEHPNGQPASASEREAAGVEVVLSATGPMTSAAKYLDEAADVATSASKVSTKTDSAEDVLRWGDDVVFAQRADDISWLRKVDSVSEIPNGCEKVADKLVSALGDGAEYLEITSVLGTEFRIGPVMKEATEWFWHVAAIKDGRVYDRLTGAAGMDLEDYMKLFDYSESLKFTQTKTRTLK